MKRDVTNDTNAPLYYSIYVRWQQEPLIPDVIFCPEFSTPRNEYLYSGLQAPQKGQKYYISKMADDIPISIIERFTIMFVF